MRRSSSARNTNMSRSLAKRVVFSFVTVIRLPNSPGTRQCPETPSPKRSTSASTIPDPAISETGRGAQLAPGRDAEAVILVAQRREHADVLDLAGEAQIVVQRIRDDLGRHSALAEVRRRRRRPREAADLPKALVRRCQQLAGDRPPPE